MRTQVRYRVGRTQDVEAIQKVELAAGQRFLDVGMPEIAADGPPERRVLRDLIDREQLWVATTASGQVIGYCMAVAVDRDAHIDQVSVHCDYARQGIGAKLVERACEWATNREATRISVFTFEHVPWNAPYYRRLGFEDLDIDNVGKELAAIWQAERLTDLANWVRIALARPLTD